MCFQNSLHHGLCACTSAQSVAHDSLNEIERGLRQNDGFCTDLRLSFLLETKPFISLILCPASDLTELQRADLRPFLQLFKIIPNSNLPFKHVEAVSVWCHPGILEACSAPSYNLSL